MIISNIFYSVFYQPFLNLLLLLYQILPGDDFGLAIILLTVLVKVILFPLELKSLKSQQKISEIQGRLKELQEKFKDNKERLNKEILGLYKQAGVNPLFNLVLFSIQIPILIALYQIFFKGFLSPENDLYGFIRPPEKISPFFLFGAIDLSQTNWLLAVIASGLQFLQGRIGLGKPQKTGRDADQIQRMFKNQMLYFLPFFTLLILLKVPSALALYLIVSSTLSLVQQQLCLKKKI